MTLFPFDELNILKSEIEAAKSDPEEMKKRRDYYIDEVTDLFVLAYVYGTAEVGNELNDKIQPDMEQMREAISVKFDGKDYIDRLNDYIDGGTAYDIDRVIDTDTHRIYNAAKFNGAKKLGATDKTWRTQLDPLVRDSHDYLEGVTVPIDAEFYTFNGNHTLYPSQFGVPEEDIGCRCWVEFSKL